MSNKRFQEFLNKNNFNITILESTEKTHTAKEAADAHNVSVADIVKSILVKIDSSFILFLVPGDKQIDLKKKAKEFNTKECRIAKPEEVKKITGYSIGGVPPFGHKNLIETHIEEGFKKNQIILAAGGSPNSVFKMPFEDLNNIILTLQQPLKETS